MATIIVQKDNDLQNIHIKLKIEKIWIPLKTGCFGRVSSSCSTSGTHRVNLVTNQVIAFSLIYLIYHHFTWRTNIYWSSIASQSRTENKSISILSLVDIRLSLSNASQHLIINMFRAKFFIDIIFLQFPGHVFLQTISIFIVLIVFHCKKSLKIPKR